MPGFNSQSNAFTSPLSHIGTAFQGSKLSGRDFYFGHGSSSETKTEDCIAALFLTSPRHDRQKHITYKGDITPGTCKWIEQDTIYTWWKNGGNAGPQLVWLSAGGGEGKTMLSIYATQELERWIDKEKGSILLYYFCDGRDESRNMAISVLRSLVHQLVSQLPALIEIYMKAYNQQKQNLFRQAAIEPLWDVFEKMVRESGMEKIYCWIDGLDECEVGNLDHLCRKLKQYFQATQSGKPEDANVKKPTESHDIGQLKDSEATGTAEKADERRNSRQPSLRMLIVSREEPRCLSRELSNFPRIQFASASQGKSSKDLEVYIKAKTKELSIASGVPAANEDWVSNKLVENEEGTFLWVDMAMDKLRSSSLSRVFEQVEQLPNNVEDMIGETLAKIPPDWALCVQALLKWVLLAVRPLKMAELREAIGCLAGLHLSMDHMNIAISLCESLLVIHDQEVLLAHHRMRAFFLERHEMKSNHRKLQPFFISEASTNSELANACIAYLENGSLVVDKEKFSLKKMKQSPDCVHVARADGSKMLDLDTSHLAKFPFLNYAVLHWPHHARLGDVKCTNFKSTFFDQQSETRNLWWKTHWISTRARAAWRFIVPHSFSLLHFAAYFGIVPLALHIESSGRLWQTMQERDSHGNRPLAWAVAEVRPAMTQFLLERDALRIPDDKFSGQEMPILEWAILSGELETVNYLLKSGIPAGATTKQMKTVSEIVKGTWAAARYWKDLLNLLAQDHYFNDWTRSKHAGAKDTHIHTAAACGNEDIFHSLLRYGADPRSRTSTNWQPVHDAAWYGHAGIIDILVDSGADTQAESLEMYTALHCAAHEGHAECVRRLLHHGSSVFGRTKKGKTPLITAAKVNNPSVIKILLDAKANIEATCNFGGTPLLHAIVAGTEATVGYLLFRGADIGQKKITLTDENNITTVQKINAFKLAESQGKKPILKLLNDFTRDPNEFRRRYFQAEPSTTDTLEETIPNRGLTSHGPIDKETRNLDPLPSRGSSFNSSVEPRSQDTTSTSIMASTSQSTPSAANRCVSSERPEHPAPRYSATASEVPSILEPVADRNAAQTAPPALPDRFGETPHPASSSPDPISTPPIRSASNSLPVTLNRGNDTTGVSLPSFPQAYTPQFQEAFSSSQIPPPPPTRLASSNAQPGTNISGTISSSSHQPVFTTLYTPPPHCAHQSATFPPPSGGMATESSTHYTNPPISTSSYTPAYPPPLRDPAPSGQTPPALPVRPPSNNPTTRPNNQNSPPTFSPPLFSSSYTLSTQATPPSPEMPPPPLPPRATPSPNNPLPGLIHTYNASIIPHRPASIQVHGQTPPPPLESVSSSPDEPPPPLPARPVAGYASAEHYHTSNNASIYPPTAGSNASPPPHYPTSPSFGPPPGASKSSTHPYSSSPPYGAPAQQPVLQRFHSVPSGSPLTHSYPHQQPLPPLPGPQHLHQQQLIQTHRPSHPCPPNMPQYLQPSPSLSSSAMHPLPPHLFANPGSLQPHATVQQHLQGNNSNRINQSRIQGRS